MEGPSLFLAAEQLNPFLGQRIEEVGGNTKIAKERLLNQEILSIFSNEVLLLAKISPLTQVKDLSTYKLKKLIALTTSYVHKFYEWRKNFELKKHYQIYRQSSCKVCGSKVLRMRTGLRKRLSYICPRCETI